MEEQISILLILMVKKWMISLSPSEEKKQKTHHSGGIAIDKNNLYVATGLENFFC